MIRCIIVEDQPPAQHILETFISDTPDLESIGVFHDPISALDFLKRESVDLIFLDIHLPKISGLDFLKVLPEKPAIILTTAFPDYALESYELDVLDYLLKPFSFQRFLKAVSKLPKKQETRSLGTNTIDAVSKKEAFLLRSGHELIRIAFESLYYIKAGSDYCELVTSEKKYLSQDPLKSWVQKLSNQGFCQCHKSYVVNIHKIRKIVTNQIHLYDKTVLPMGRAYKEGVLEQFTQ